MDGARDQFLAGAGLTKEQHSRIGRRHRFDSLQHTSQRGTLPDDVGELLVKLALEVLLLVGQLRVETGHFLVGPRILDSDGDLRGGLSEERDVLFRKCVRVGAAHVQRSKLAVPRHERYAAHRLESGRLHHRSAIRPELFQIRSAEDPRHASLKRHARGRAVRRQREVGRGRAPLLVVDPLQPQRPGVLIVQRKTDVVVLDDSLHRFGDRLEQRGVVEV